MAPMETTTKIFRLLLPVLGALSVGNVGLCAEVCETPTVFVRAELINLLPSGIAQIHVLGDPLQGKIAAEDIVFETGPHFRVIQVYQAKLSSKVRVANVWALDRRSSDSRLVFCKILPNIFDPTNANAARGGTDKRAVTSSRKSKKRKGVCHRRRCPFRGKCVVVGGRPLCRCQSLCPTRYRPVCGSDGRTYANMCILKRTACLRRRKIRTKHPGKCGARAVSDPCKAITCSHPFHECRVQGHRGVCTCPFTCPNPSPDKDAAATVCGSDGVSYRTSCHLRRQACRQGRDTKALHRGACSNVAACKKLGLTCAPTQLCQADSDGKWRCVCPKCDAVGKKLLGPQVCAKNGVTRQSACHLLKEACQTGRANGIKHDGPCGVCERFKCDFFSLCHVNRFGRPECVCPNSCPKETGAVCGSDGRTYSSVCEMRMYSCSVKRNITAIAKEPCRRCLGDCPVGTECFHGHCRCRVHCPSLTMTVCGSDGRLYRNECELKRRACLTDKSITIDATGKACPRNDAPLIKKGNKLKERTSGNGEKKENGDNRNFLWKSGPDIGISMTKKSFASLPPIQSFRRYHTLHLTVIPNSLNGSIIYLGRTKTNARSDMMSIVLKEGYVIYRYNLGSGPLILKSKKPLRLGRFHRISASRKGRWGKLSVDGESWTGRSPGRLRGFTLKADHRLVLGHVATRNGNGFSGCIQSALLISHRSRKQINLIDAVTGKGDDSKQISQIQKGCQQHVCAAKPCRNGGSCNTTDNSAFKCTCSTKYTGSRCEKVKQSKRFRIPAFDGTAYITIPPSVHRLKQKKFELEFWFLTTALNGLLSQLGRSTAASQHFLRMELINGWLQISCRSGNGLVVMRSGFKIPLGEWVQLRIRKSRRFMSMSVNSQKRSRMRLVPNYFRKLEKSKKRKVTEFRASKEPLYIGGNPSNEVSNTETVWLQGGIQRIFINRKRVDLYSKSLIRSPSVGDWRGPPCSAQRTQCGVGQECQPHLNSARCVCVYPPCSEPLQQDQPLASPPDVTLAKKKTSKAIEFNGYTLLKVLNKGEKKRRRSKNNNFAVRLKTSSRQGMILLSKQPNKRTSGGNFYLLALRNGYPEVAFNVGGRHGLIRIRGPFQINDNKWHNVQAIRSGTLTTLIVDGQAVTGQMNSTKTVLHTSGWLWIGGVPMPIRGFPWEYNRGFMGCLQELFIDSESVDLWRLGTAQRGEFLACSLPYEF